MSRLTKHHDRQYRKKIIFLISISFALLILFFTTGLPLLIQASIFINSIINPQTKNTSLESANEFYGMLEIDEPPLATNSAKIIISGYVANFPEIEIYLNNKKIKTVAIRKSGEFSSQIENLEPGTNEIYVKALSKKHNTIKKTNIFSVIYKSEKPKLEIISPKDNTVVNTNEISIIGNTDKGNTLIINNYPAVVDANGRFQSVLILKEGENKIEIIASDIAGNQEKKELKVIYQKD